MKYAVTATIVFHVEEYDDGGETEVLAAVRNVIDCLDLPSGVEIPCDSGPDGDEPNISFQTKELP